MRPKAPDLGLRCDMRRALSQLCQEFLQVGQVDRLDEVAVAPGLFRQAAVAVLPQPVSAMMMTDRPHGCSRMRRVAS